VPVGALPSGTTVSVYPVTNTAPLVAAVPTGSSYVLSFAVTWESPDGTSPTATAPITMTITDPSIVAGDTIYELTSAGLEAVGTATTNGTVTITFSSDPTFLVTHTALLAQASLQVTTTSGTVGAALALATSGGSGSGAVSFSVNNGTATGCTITGSSLTVTSAGTCLVTATKAADATHSAISSTATAVTFALSAQGALDVTSTAGTVGTALALATSGGSGSGAVSYSVTNGTATGCTITGSSLTVTKAGTCLVTATKAADTTYSALSSTATTVTFVPRAVPSVVLRADKVSGSAAVGKTVTLTVAGTGFYGKPTVKSNEAGTVAFVAHDSGTLLTIRVSVKAGSSKGEHTFTIRLANGKSCKVDYVVK
jgi:hypothetical protein